MKRDRLPAHTAMTRPHTSAAPYRLAHGSTLSEAQAVQVLTRTAQGEPLDFAPIRHGHLWTLAHLATLSAAERAEHARRVQLAAQVLSGSPLPARLTA